MPTAAGTARAPRTRSLGKIAILVAVLMLAFLVSRTCGATTTQVSEQKAIAIAREEIDYEPEKTQIRIIRRGVPSRTFWAVSLQLLDAKGDIERATVVLVDAQTGEIAEVRTSR